MKSINWRGTNVLALVLLAIGWIAPAAGAQEAQVLTIVQVQQLVERGEPADHARLSAHFAALADRYAADAERHAAMSRAYAANRRAGLATTMRSHCTRLADLATQSAGTLRELVAYHEELAAGQQAAPPSEGARFESGAGAAVPTKEELDDLAKRATTPADHRALEEYFQTLAKRYAADAERDEAAAAAYRGTRVRATSARFDRLASLARDAAKEASAAAAMHEDLANAGR